jgi:hypothetical protein
MGGGIAARNHLPLDNHGVTHTLETNGNGFENLPQLLATALHLIGLHFEFKLLF